MKKFVVKSLYFIIPILILQLYTFCFYSSKESPDLLRLGYIPNINWSYRDVFSKEFENEIHFTKLSETKKKKFKVLTIGDSFSGQSNYGYKNYLGVVDSIDVLHVDNRINSNQIQRLYNLINGGFFDTYKIEYVILESIERDIVIRAQNIDTTKTMIVKKITELHNAEQKSEGFNTSFFSNKAIKFSYYSFKYLIYEDLLVESVYCTKTTKHLFSIPTKKLYFYNEDLINLVINNNLEKVNKLNERLNDLSFKLGKKGVKLIVLPCPDKYDIYYEYILNKTNYPKPVFFELMRKMNKSYLYVDSKNILDNALKVKEDIYFYDDTHWTPWASQIIAKEIEKMVIEN